MEIFIGIVCVVLIIISVGFIFNPDIKNFTSDVYGTIFVGSIFIIVASVYTLYCYDILWPTIFFSIAILGFML